jgi:hypothetical protein
MITTWQKILLSALMISALLAVVALAFGPHSSKTSECLFCGRSRYEVSWLGLKTSDKVIEHDWSAWVDGLHPTHAQHIWSATSHEYRSWFGPTTIGCGGIGGVISIYQVRSRVGEAKARELLDKYHAMIGTDVRSLLGFMQSEVHPLLTPAS